MSPLIVEIVSNPLSSVLVIGNLVLIESLLSVDNAAVLATMVLDLPTEERKKALRYGIFGAYIFRGISLLLASVLVKIWWLKVLGGIYLIYLFWKWLKNKWQKTETEQQPEKARNTFYNKSIGRLGNFWTTVILVELMDLAFSIDNIFAAVALSENILIILTGVFIGILAMRFVAQAFVKLMERYPFLEWSAYTVIAILGIKLVLSISGQIAPTGSLSKMLDSEITDWVTSVITISIFLLPLITNAVFGIPRRKSK